MTFKRGDKVTCVWPTRYRTTEGKIYTIKDYSARSRDDSGTFMWPAYVLIEDDYGNDIVLHADRFKLLVENSDEQTTV